MTEKDFDDYGLILKEIDILSKELLNLNSDKLIVKQAPEEKIYVGPIINKILGELENEIERTEKRLRDMLHRLCTKRNCIEDYINSVENCEIRLILRLRYIEGMTYKEIASRIQVNGRSKDGLHNVTWTALSYKIKSHFNNQRV